MSRTGLWALGQQWNSDWVAPTPTPHPALPSGGQSCAVLQCGQSSALLGLWRSDTGSQLPWVQPCGVWG